MKNKFVEKKTIKKINKNLSSIKSHCQTIADKYKESSETMSKKDYIYFVFSADIVYRIKDIIFLNKKLSESKNSFDSSLYVLSRSVLETFIYLKYLLSEEDKIDFKLKSFMCYTTRNDMKIFSSLKALGDKGKFIFSDDDNDVLSLKMINEKISEWDNDIKKYKNNTSSEIENEINDLKNVEEIAKRYDKIKGINKVNDGEENKSLEWVYNYVYRFQCMSTHQNLRDKEKVFKLYLEDKTEPNNLNILLLMEYISKQVLELYN